MHNSNPKACKLQEICITGNFLGGGGEGEHDGEGRRDTETSWLLAPGSRSLRGNLVEDMETVLSAEGE